MEAPTNIRPGAQDDVIDPTATFALHCGNGFVAGYSLYQSTRLSR
jgi:hypothetical protein